MEPIPETRKALEELGRTGDGDLLPTLLDTADRVRAIVPSLVGLSLALRRDDVTFTFVASSEEVRRADAAQYLDGGPCLEGADLEEVVVFEGDDPLHEGRWAVFARATAADGIATSLTLPIVDSSRSAVGSINLYAGQRGAFDERHEEVAAVVDAWAPGAVADADLSFETRRAAEAAPYVLEEKMTMDQALGVLSSSRGITVDEAREVLRDVARRSGTTQLEIARLVLSTMGRRRRAGGADPDDGGTDRAS